MLTELGFALAQGYHYSESHSVAALIDDLNEKQGRIGGGASRELGGAASSDAGGWIPLD